MSTREIAIADARLELADSHPFPDMVWVPSTTYRMGSDDHYPEERPAHRVSVDGFWIDKYPVTRFPEPVDTSTCHVGFRCIVRPTSVASPAIADQSAPR